MRRFERQPYAGILLLAVDEGGAQDPHYAVRVIPVLQQTGDYLAELDKNHPGSDWLCECNRNLLLPGNLPRECRPENVG